MITEALLHCPGIGPARLAKLHALGVHSWHDVLEQTDLIPSGWRGGLASESRRCLDALDAGDIAYFVQRLAPPDRWRILSQYLGDVSYFDIETAGLEYDDPITLIVCWHRGQLHTFVEHENLDEFLPLLDDVTLLTSFNGASFDVPRVLDTFHIPALPCPHLDLRWLCYHQGLHGGLKQITQRKGLERPADLQDADGELAILLWSRWQHFHDRNARDELIRYCASDVLLLVALTRHLVGTTLIPQHALWSQLPTTQAAGAIPTPSPPPESQAAQGAFGEGSPARLRGRRRMVG